MDWKELCEVNDQISTIEISNKTKDKNGNWVFIKTKYATVSSRVAGFRKLIPNGSIETNLQYDNDYVYATATIYNDDNHILATGNAREFKANKFAPEVAESSAVGRALGFLGIGIQNGIASAEDMQKKNDNELFDVPIDDKEKLVVRFKTLYTVKEQVAIMNRKQITDVSQMDIEALKRYVADREEQAD